MVKTRKGLVCPAIYLKVPRILFYPGGYFTICEIDIPNQENLIIIIIGRQNEYEEKFLFTPLFDI